MNAVRFVFASLVLVMVVGPSQGANSIGGVYANADMSGYVTAGGFLNLDYGAIPASTVTVKVFKNGEAVATFPANVTGKTFSGKSTRTFSAGTYKVEYVIAIDSEDYSYVLDTFTVK